VGASDESLAGEREDLCLVERKPEGDGAQMKTAVPEPYGLSARQSATGALSRSLPQGTEREQLLDRLQQLRSILPVFAQELAGARRQAAALRLENRGLLAEVRRLRTQRAQDAPKP
jgi:hypothetical protein